ncbi:MAG: response regulator transcription factor [Ferrimicrobium sp.]
MQILIVEDHPEVQRWLGEELSSLGWRCDLAGTASLARSLARHSTYDAVLLDVMLPDGDGTALCLELRGFTNAAIIMVTARDDTIDRINALDGGADDYVTKPFVIEELVARIRAILRRTTGDRGPALEFCDLRLWPQERTVEQQGHVLELSRREFDLLRTFMENANQVLDREQCLELAWGYDFYGESNVVDVTVKRLRDRLDPDGEVAIATLRGIGYILRSVRD